MPDHLGARHNSLHDPAEMNHSVETACGDLLSKKKMQMRYVFYYLAVLVPGALLLAGLVYRRAHRILHFEMFKGHSKIANTWDLFQPIVLSTSVLITLLLIGSAFIIIPAVSWVIHRASERLASNLRGYTAGKDPSSWEAIRHPREFGHLQKMLAGALRLHGRRIRHLNGELEALRAKVAKTRESCLHEKHLPHHIQIRNIHVRCERFKHLFREFHLR